MKKVTITVMRQKTLTCFTELNFLVLYTRSTVITQKQFLWPTLTISVYTEHISFCGCCPVVSILSCTLTVPLQLQITFCVGLCFVIGVVCSFGLFRAFIYRNELFYMGVLNFIWYMYYLFFVLFFIAVGSKITREVSVSLCAQSC